MWEGAEAVLDRLERWRAVGWVEHPGGGLQVCPTPEEGDRAHLHWVYPGLSEARLVATEIAYDRPLPPEYRRFLSWANGVSLFAHHFGLLGSHLRGDERELIDRSGLGIGQPVSLDYGNQIGRPANAPQTSWVIGTISGWAGQGNLLLNQGGEVRLCALADADDVAMVWPTLTDLILDEFERMGALVDDRGALTAPHEHFLPEPARRWEPRRQEARHGLFGWFRKR